METFLAAQTEHFNYLWDLVSQNLTAAHKVHTYYKKMCLYILILLRVCKFL